MRNGIALFPFSSSHHMRFTYVLESEWPSLAWLAVCENHSDDIVVYHGNRVECREHWFCEAIWDGPFGEGNFDQTDVVFGSGGRLRDQSVVFVTAGSMLDRIHSMQLEHQTLVSNSLVCLAAEIGATPDPTYTGFQDDFESVIQGIYDYNPFFKTNRGDIRMTYYRNLRWDRSGVTLLEKPYPRRDFSTFDGYVGFLRDVLRKVGQNIDDPGRQFPTGKISALSSGYDSTTVTTLAYEIGLRESFSMRQGRGTPHDSGIETARALGLQLHIVDREGFRRKPFSEVPFIAADGRGEDVYYCNAEAHLFGKVVFTGYNGDGVWDKKYDSTSENLVRMHHSGMSLTEYRLWAGFIHFPVAYLGSRQAKDISALNRDPELKPWDYSSPHVKVPYSRPICRRIVETAGVSRAAFGQWKRMASVLFSSVEALSAGSMKDYLDWLKQNRDRWSRIDKTPPYPAPLSTRVIDLTARGLLALSVLKGVRRFPKVRRMGQKLRQMPQMQYQYLYLFPWAFERAKQRYRRSGAFTIHRSTRKTEVSETTGP